MELNTTKEQNTPELVAAIVRLKAKMRVLFAEQDMLMYELLDRADAWGKLFEVDGEIWILRDNFSGNNKVFHATAFCHYDVKEATKKEIDALKHD